METKAHYAAVGGFVLAAAVALVVVLLWFAGAQYAQEYDYYETDFTGAVTGLGQGTSVRYNGIEVGHVNELKFDPNDPKVVRVIMEVQGGLPIHADSVASIESQGLAGGSYVLITGGTKDSPLLRRLPGQEYPIIRSKPSSLEQLFADTPLLMARLNVVADRFGKLLDEENREAFKQILLNIRDTTGVVGKHNADIEATLANLATGTRNLDTALHSVDLAAVRADTAISHIDQLASNLNDVVGASKSQLSQLTGQGAAQLTQLIAEMRTMVASITRLSNSLERNPQRLLTGDRGGGYRPQ
jgi:phospholipid/cholesterol/gamma-HCH transport system substrate-binding protein